MGNMVVDKIWIMYGLLVQILYNWNWTCTRIEITIKQC